MEVRITPDANRYESDLHAERWQELPDHIFGMSCKATQRLPET